MTLTIGILTNLLNRFLEKDGVLYCACEMGFYEEIIFKEQNIEKFIGIAHSNAFKISAIKAFDLDEMIEEEMNRIYSRMI